MTGGIKIALIALSVSLLASCGSGEPEFDVQEMLAKPKTYMGSDQCRTCHLEHYDSWKTTLHSRTIQDVSENLDAITSRWTGRCLKEVWTWRRPATKNLPGLNVWSRPANWKINFQQKRRLGDERSFTRLAMLL